MDIQIKRAYDPPSSADGARYLVDWLWPRGVKRENLQLVDWLKEVAPSNDLRIWFGHDPDRWEEFRARYFKELEENPLSWQALVDAARHRRVTLVYSARDTLHNQAAALKEFLARHVDSAK